jgi:hypothetical protein
MTARRAARRPQTAAQQPISVASAAKTGDTLAALVALRDRLAQQLDETHSGRDTAALSRQLSAVLAQIEDRPKPVPSKRDEIAAKRAARLAAVAAAHGNDTETTGGSS